MSGDEIVLPRLETPAEQAARREYYTKLRALEGEELARAVLVLIEDLAAWGMERARTGTIYFRPRWGQGSWRENGHVGERYEDWRDDPLSPECKTSFCFAGWVGAIDGVKWVRGSIDTVATRCTCTTPDCVLTSWSEAHGQMSIATYAAQRLGLGTSDADELFNGNNELDDLRALVDAIATGQNLDEVPVERHGEGRTYESRDDDSDEYGEDD